MIMPVRAAELHTGMINLARRRVVAMIAESLPWLA
jgi:hypothetical protein